jgi:hypothetical protein
MRNHSDPRLLDVSKDWKENTDQILNSSTAELARRPDRHERQRKLSATRAAELTSMKMARDIAKLAQEAEESHQHRQEWVKSRISDINQQTGQDIRSLEGRCDQEEKFFQAQLTEENGSWETAVLERKEEVAHLQSVILRLTSAISVAQEEMKADIHEAKRRAQETARVIRANREKQSQEIADLNGEIQKEQTGFEFQARQLRTQKNRALQERKAELERLEAKLGALKAKRKENEGANDARFDRQCRMIKKLRVELDQARVAEKQRQHQVKRMRKACASVTRKLSVMQIEAASLMRSIGANVTDTEDMRTDIMKLGTTMFP